MENPPIKILQRPVKSSEFANSKPPVAIKSLEEKEADYFAARRRIMESDSPGRSAVEINLKRGKESVSRGNGQNGNSARSTATTQRLTNTQTCPTTLAGDFGDWGYSLLGSTVSLLPDSLVTNVSGKQRRQQQSPSQFNTATGNYLLMQQQQQRVLSSSSSSPSFFGNSSRTTTTQPIIPPLFGQVGSTNAGLLPTPPGLNYTAQLGGANNATFQQPHTSTLGLRPPNLFQQQPQVLNGFHNQFLSSNVLPGNASFIPFSLSSANPQVNVNYRQTHPPAFR